MRHAAAFLHRTPVFHLSASTRHPASLPAAAYHALYLDAKPDAKGNGRAVAYIAGPAAMPAGESTMYVLLNVLGDPKLITAGAALVAQAVDAAGADAPAPAPRTST